MSDLLFSRPMLRRILAQAELMDRMLLRLGVDEAALARLGGGMGLYEARTRCLACRNERACRAWLEGWTDPADPSEFCPNASFFARCRPVGTAPACRTPTTDPFACPTTLESARPQLATIDDGGRS
jgi:hypothetical protein